MRSVCRCAKKDSDLIQTHGYSFCYKEDYYEGWTPRQAKKSSYICSDETREKMRNNKRSKRVLCIETNQVFISIKQAGRETGFSATSITRSCKDETHLKTAGGYHWIYLNEKKI